MKAIAEIALICILVATLAACDLVSPKPTPMPTETETDPSGSIFSNVPTNTPKTVGTVAQSSMTGLPMPSKTPFETWQGIKIMPAAIAGDEITGGYYFAVDAAVEEIQGFYDSEMQSHGWDLVGVEQGTVGNKMMIFKKDDRNASISITPQSDGNVYVVISV